MTHSNPALDALRRAVTGRIESGDAVAIVEVPAPHVIESRMFDPAPDGWEDYELVNAAQHAANPHRFEGEL